MNLTENEKSLLDSINKWQMDKSSWTEMEENKEADSYYVDYSNAKHIGDDIIMEYDFDTPLEFKTYLDSLWNDQNECYKEMTNVILKCMIDNRDKIDNFLPEVDTFNYMM